MSLHPFSAPKKQILSCCAVVIVIDVFAHGSSSNTACALTWHASDYKVDVHCDIIIIMVCVAIRLLHSSHDALQYNNLWL